MKSFIVLITLLSSHVFATSNQHIKPKLRFSHSNKNISQPFSDKYLKVQLHDLKYFPEGEQKEKLFQAISLIEDVVNSVEFKELITHYLNSRSEHKYQRNYLWRNSKDLLSNKSIYDIIMEGDEKMFPNTNGTIDLKVMGIWCSGLTYYRCKDVVGYTSPNSSQWIRVYKNFYLSSKFEIADMVGNLVHEWIHLLGFLHGKHNTSEEPTYVIGAIAKKIAEAKLGPQ